MPARLVRNHLVESSSLTLKVLVLRDTVKVRAGEVLGLLSHVDSLLEAIGVNLTSSNNTVAVDDISGGRELHTGEIDSLLDESDSLTSTTDCLQVTESLADPVDSATVLTERLDGLGTTRDEDTVVHGGALALEVVVCYDTRAALVLAIGVDLVSPGGDGEGKSAGSGQRSLDAVVSDLVVAIGDEDSNHAGSDGRRLGHELHL